MADDTGLAEGFYRHVLEELNTAGVPFLVGGTYALSHYVGYERPTKDIDLFVEPDVAPLVLQHFKACGFQTEMAFPHWLGKIRCGAHFADVIFSSGNGVARVDRRWFAHARSHVVFGVPTLLSPAEEMLWSKAFVQERERYDGGDVIHLLYHQGPEMDWGRLLERFGPHWRLLFSFIVLFGFVYPGARDRIPSSVVDDLMARFVIEEPDRAYQACNGPLLSREQYLPDLDRGMLDPRLAPLGRMTAEELERWTSAIGRE